MKAIQLKLYRVLFDGSWTYVEAASMSAALAIWHPWMVTNVDMDSDAEAEAVELMESHEPVLR